MKFPHTITAMVKTDNINEFIVAMEDGSLYVLRQLQGHWEWFPMRLPERRA